MWNAPQCCLFARVLVSLALAPLIFAWMYNVCFIFTFHVPLQRTDEPPCIAFVIVHSMLDFQKAKGLMEISMLMFAFYTVVTERQEQDAIEWHVSEREGNILHSLSAARFGENPDFSC